MRVTSSLNLRNGPSTSNTVIAVMPTGTIVTVVGGPSVGGGYTWWQVSGPYGTGWAVGTYLVKVTAAAAASESVLAAEEGSVVEAPDAPAPAAEAASPGAVTEPAAAYQPARIKRTANSVSGEVLVDGDLATSWTTVPGAPPRMASFTVDLDEVETVAALRWISGEQGISGTLRIETSADGETWTGLATVDAVEAGTWQTMPVVSEIRYVRFVFVNTTAADWLGGVAEVELLP